MNPIIQTEGSAGADLFAAEDVMIRSGDSAVVSTGYHYDISRPALVKGRSGLAFKHSVVAFEGLIDSDFRDEVKVKLFNLGTENVFLKAGDRVAQIVILPDVETDLWYDTLDEARAGGFGSTDK